MAIISWDETSPPDASSAGLGDDAIRSLKTSLRGGLEVEHVWPSATGEAGVHRLGSARAYVGTQSQVSSSGTDGRIMFASNTSQFFHVGSGGTSLIGGSRVLSVGTTVGFTYPQRHQWVEEFGLARIASGSTLTSVTFPNSGYSGVPFVWWAQNETDGVATAAIDFIVACAMTPTGFTLMGTGSSGYTVAWFSRGTRVL